MWQFAVTQRLPGTLDPRAAEPSAREFLRAIEETIREVQIEAEALAWMRDLQADLQRSRRQPQR